MVEYNLRITHQITFEVIERINTIHKMIYRFEIGDYYHYIIFASIDDVMDNIDTITSSILSLNVGGFVEAFPKEQMGRYHQYHQLGKENYISNYYIKFIASEKLRREMIELFDDGGGGLIFYYNFETKNQPIYIPF